MKSANRLTSSIAVSMVLGILIGYACHRVSIDAGEAKTIAGYLSIISEIFLRMIRMIIGPLVFATLVSGIASMDDSKSIGRVALITLGWFFAASLLSLGIGLLFANAMHPGTDTNAILPAAGSTTGLATGAPDLKTFVTRIFPRSIFEALAGNDVMQILVFSLFFGLALRKVTGETGLVLRRGVDGLMNVMLRITNMVMRFAPLGIFSALSAVITVQGLSVLLTYGKFIGCFYAALAALWMLLFLAGYAVLKRRMYSLIRLIREPIMIAFSTASSEAAYPQMLECLQRFGVEKRLVGFVLPLGYSFNLDGSMIYQAFASIFIAEAFHVQMTLGQQITMLLVLMISSKGMAAVPRGSLVVVAAILPMFGLPEAGLLLVMGIDQFLDMGRTATNAWGNSIATAVVANWENELGPELA